MNDEQKKVIEDTMRMMVDDAEIARVEEIEAYLAEKYKDVPVDNINVTISVLMCRALVDGVARFKLPDGVNEDMRASMMMQQMEELSSWHLQYALYLAAVRGVPGIDIIDQRGISEEIRKAMMEKPEGKLS